jgi:hypothetical protein
MKKMMLLLIGMVVVLLAGCSAITKNNCLVPCYSEAIDEHFKSPLEQRSPLDDCDIRDSELFNAKIKCASKCIL